jgi:hypothetical protein
VQGNGKSLQGHNGAGPTVSRKAAEQLRLTVVQMCLHVLQGLNFQSYPKLLQKIQQVTFQLLLKVEVF